MQILCWNIRGFGRSFKKRAVKNMVLDKKISFLMLQEMKLEAISPIVVRMFWDIPNGKCEVVPSVGLSGGLIMLWDEDVFTAEEVRSSCR